MTRNEFMSALPTPRTQNAITPPTRSTAPGVISLGAKKKGQRLGDKVASGDWFGKVFLWGDLGTGKTLAIADILRMGYKVAVLSTDIGGSGLETVINIIRRDFPSNWQSVLNNLLEYEASKHEDVVSFIEKPPEDLFAHEPDWLVWDGFHGWQGTMLQDFASGLSFVTGNKVDTLSEAEQTGFKLSERHYGIVSSATVELFSKFLILHGAKRWHKLITCNRKEEKKKLSGDRVEGTGVYIPNIIGGIGNTRSLEGGFDLSLGTERTEGVFGGKKGTLYTYTVSKERGLVPPPEALNPASFEKAWRYVAGLHDLKIPADVLDKPPQPAV